MNFKFLHAADLHLGSPLTGLSLRDPDVARRFSSASRDAFSELVSTAIAEKVDFVVVAGDIYDGDWKDMAIGLFFNREVSRLHRAGIPVFLIRGNHDAESEITKAVPLPDGVQEFRTRRADTHKIETLKVAIHGRSFADKAAPENFALEYPSAVPGWFNIGLLHTSLEGNAAHAVYAPCSVADLAGRGYDYWALGHIHEHSVVSRDPYVVYSGNLQGRSVRECGPKGAILVDVQDGRVADLRNLVLDRARWLHEKIDISQAADERAVLDLVRETLRVVLATTDGRLTAARISLTGSTRLHGPLTARASMLRDEIQATMDHLHDDCWLESLKLATREPAQPTAPASNLDPRALLAGLETDADLRAQAEDLVALVKAKLPGNLDTSALDDLDSLMADARALAAARALSGPQV